jgi:hypothetical protein
LAYPEQSNAAPPPNQYRCVAAYIADLSEDLRREMDQQDPPTVEAMTVLGIPRSEWYRVLLSQQGS